MAETKQAPITEADAFAGGFKAVQFDDEFYRRDMRHDTLYYEFDSNAWYFTTDNEGITGYDTLAEAKEQTGLDRLVWTNRISEYYDENGYKS